MISFMCKKLKRTKLLKITKCKNFKLITKQLNHTISDLFDRR